MQILKRCNGLPLAMDLSRSKCDGCNSAIEDGRSVNALGGVWHPECFCCLACHKPIAMHEFSNSKGKFHKSCYRKHRHPNCYVCKEKIPATAEVIKYNEHPFWLEKYCPSHDVDGTAKCCSCERLKPMEANYVMLGDGRWICLECCESSIMDTHECQELHFEIREFFEALDMKIEKEFPLLLVEQRVLNRTKEDVTIDHNHDVVIRGSCFSEEQIISTVSRGPKMGPNGIFSDMRAESQMLVRQCKVTAVLVMCGLPRLLTGSISVHEMMHAWLRLNGYNDLTTELEEGLCQVIAHMWLESQTNVLKDAAAASSSHMPTKATNQPRQSDFEKKLVELYKMQIEDDYSPYGDGFKKVSEMVSNSSVHETLKSFRSSESVVDDAYHINESRARKLLKGKMILKSQTNVLTDAAAASSSHMPTKATNQPRQSDSEKKLVELYKMQIEDDYSPYGHGDGFRKVSEMVSNSSLDETLKSIRSSESVVDDAYHINTYTRRTFTNKVHEGITKFPFRWLVCFFMIIACFFLVKSLWSSV